MSAVPPLQVHDDEPESIVRIMLTTSQATDLFLGDLTRRGYSHRTIDTYRRLLDKLADRLPNDLDVAKITVDDCRRFQNTWNGRAAGTRSHVYAVLSSFFGYLYVTGKIKRNPLERLERPRRIPAEDLDVTTVSSADVRKLLKAAHSWPEKLAIGILVYMVARAATGILRRAEKRGRKLPEHLAQALEAVANEGTPSTATGPTSPSHLSQALEAVARTTTTDKQAC